MERAEWASRWSEGRIAFHQPAVSDFLDAYADRVYGGGRLGRVYVPLCGKSLDLVYLAQRATEVVGVEYVEQAVEDFFAERDLTPARDGEPLVCYRAGPYRIYAADFFAVTEAELGPVDAVFDRAALVALDRPTRARYVVHLGSLLPAGATILLITFDYDQSEMNGPPFAVANDEVDDLYGDGFEVEHLETREVLNDEFRARGLTAMTESVFAITRT